MLIVTSDQIQAVFENQPLRQPVQAFPPPDTSDLHLEEVEEDNDNARD